MLSNASKYAIRAMIYLAINAENKSKTGIKKISDELKIPAPFLAKILQLLAKNKLLVSSKGPNGGFVLNKNPEKITLYDIVSVIDVNDDFNTCLISLRSCNEEGIPCPLHSKYETLRIQLKDLFKNENLASLAKDIKAQKKIFSLL